MEPSVSSSYLPHTLSKVNGSIAVSCKDVVGRGATPEIFAAPQHEYTKTLLAAALQ